MSEHEYDVLADETIDKIEQYSGKPRADLEQMLSQSISFGWVEVFWRDATRWWSMRIDAPYVYRDEVDEIMQRLLDKQYRHVE